MSDRDFDDAWMQDVVSESNDKMPPEPSPEMQPVASQPRATAIPTKEAETIGGFAQAAALLCFVLSALVIVAGVVVAVNVNSAIPLVSYGASGVALGMQGVLFLALSQLLESTNRIARTLNNRR